MKTNLVAATLFLSASLVSVPAMWAQHGPPPPPPPAGQRGPGQPPPGQRGPGRQGPGGRGGFSATLRMPPGRWWDDPHLADTVGLSPAQVRKMDAIFDSARGRLIDLDTAVRKADSGLQTQLDHDPIDRAQAVAQIERQALARAELEKANAAMLLDIRLQLTHEQWEKLAVQPPPPGR